jgi:hypothetical protein
MSATKRHYEDYLAGQAQDPEAEWHWLYAPEAAEAEYWQHKAEEHEQATRFFAHFGLTVLKLPTTQRLAA